MKKNKVVDLAGHNFPLRELVPEFLLWICVSKMVKGVMGKLYSSQQVESIKQPILYIMVITEEMPVHTCKRVTTWQTHFALYVLLLIIRSYFNLIKEQFLCLTTEDPRRLP